jgi:nucleotide-binding universal stress UspA family protein
MPLSPFFAPQDQRPTRVLVVLDGSPLTEEALMPAAFICAALAAPATGILHLLQVVRPLESEGTEDEEAKAGLLARVNEQMSIDAKAYLQQVAQRLQKGEVGKLGLTVTTSVVISPHITDALIEVAERSEAASAKGRRDEDVYDVIALTTHGRGGIEHGPGRSPTEHVLGAATLPLLIVRPSEAAFKDAGA